jgi:hypothetical protein
MKSGVRRLVLAIIGGIGIVGAGVGVTDAQQIWRGGYGTTPPRFPTPTTFGGSFNFCRVMFSSDRREKHGWDTDYPGADINFSIRLSELTKADVKMDHRGSEDETPDAVVVRLTDEALFQCPFVIMEDAGTARLNGPEAARLREFLLKGGFLLVADYHGRRAKAQWDEEIGRVLPPSRYPIVDLAPDHAVWHTLFHVKQIPQMASIQTWRRTGGVLERWNYEGAAPDARGIADEHGRLMVVMLHNTDIPDGWEREGEDREYFYHYSPDAYAVGIDIMMYTMTH